MSSLEFSQKSKQEASLLKNKQSSPEESITRARKIFAMIDQEELKKVFADMIKKTNAPKHRCEDDFPEHLPPFVREGQDTVGALLKERFPVSSTQDSVSRVHFVSDKKSRSKGSLGSADVHGRTIQITPELLSQENFPFHLLSVYAHELTHLLATTHTNKLGYRNVGTVDTAYGISTDSFYVNQLKAGLSKESQEELPLFIDLVESLDEALTEYITDSVVNEYIRRTGTRSVFEDKTPDRKLYPIARKKLDSFIDILSEASGFDKEIVTQALVRTYFDNGKFFDISSLLGKSPQEKQQIIDTFANGFNFIMDRYDIKSEEERLKSIHKIKHNRQARYWVTSLFGLDQYEKDEPKAGAAAPAKKK